MKTQKLARILLVSMTLVGCARMDRDDESLVQKDLSFQNFKVFTNIELAQDGAEPSVFTPPFSDENLQGSGDESWIMRLFDWVPDGAYSSPITNNCHFSTAEDLLLRSDQTIQKQAETFQAWISKCEPELSRLHSGKFKVLIDFATAKYSMIDNKNLTKVKIDLSNGYIVRGILGLKRDGKKRPLILVQSGVHNNAGDGPSARNIMMQLFDESPFNILFIGSVTGKDFLNDNGVMTLGGIDEGRNLIEISQMIKSQAPFKDLISEVHVLGISLGGHGALYAGLYNSHLKEKPIESVMAYCPVNNLGPTMESVFDDSLRGWYYNMLTTKLLRDVYDRVPMLGELLSKGGHWTKEVVRDAVKEASFRHYRALSEHEEWTYAPLKQHKIEKPEDLWNLSQFVDQVETVSTPTMVAYSGDDYLVLPNLNSNRLIDKLKQSPNSSIGVIKFKKGNHCAATISSGWPTLSSMFRSYFLSQVKDKRGLYEATTVDLKKYLKYNKYPLSQNLKKESVQTRFEFTALKKKKYVRLQFMIFEPDNGDRWCRNYGATEAPLRCFQKEVVEVPITAFESVDVKSPKTGFEEQLLTRWLNTHVEILGANNENLLGDNKWPAYFRINGRYDH